MNQGRIIVITGAPGTGKTTTASAVAKESDLEKSVHMHTDDFYHYHVRKPSAREYDDCCNEFWNVTPYVIKGLCRKEILFAIYELNVIDTTTHSIKDTVSAVKEKIVSGTALLF